MDDDSNVVLFPVNRIANSQNVGIKQLCIPKTVEDVKSNLKLMHHVYINEVLERILPMISSQLGSIGFSMEMIGKNDLKDGALFVESFRSMLCKQYDISHPFQKLADELFEMEATGELKLVNDVNMKFAK
jgi:hypothetical protein